MPAAAALVLIAASCGRGDDADTASTTAAPATTTATTAAPATTAAGGTTDTTTAATTATTEAATTTTVAARPEGYAPTAEDIAEKCKSEPLQATEVGVTATDITITIMADIGSSLAPGFAQGNVDAINGFAKYINANGGIGCRQLDVKVWDSKLDPGEVKNGQVDACTNSFAMVGNYTVFNPDVTAMDTCVDQAGATTGLPNVAAFSVDTNEACSPMTIGVNTKAEDCPVQPNTVREFTRMKGPFTKLLELHPGLHGVYLANADLPSTIVSAMPDIAVQEQAGIVFDGKLKQFSRDTQSEYTPRIQYLLQGSNFVYNGSSDFSMALYMKEAVAQGVDMSGVVWSCNVSCYTRRLLEQGGGAVEGTYVWVQFLPFEESDTNAALQDYVDSVGPDKTDTYGVMSWQAGLAFQEAVNQLVIDQGPNSLTRANLLEALRSITNFSANGMSGSRVLTAPGPCYVLLQVQDAKYVRVWPEERGTLDCDAANLGKVSLDAEAATNDLT
jgi:ABC-type branched-subunit amino acid transport system substrate-binding protein